MGRFAGYEMPLWYPSGTKSEHLAVITRAGLFDTSHMAVVMVSGGDAFDLLQYCFSRDLRTGEGTIAAGKCLYGVFLDEDGGVLDDAVLYRLESEKFMIVVNAGMGAVIAGHLRKQGAEREVEIDDMTNRVGKVDLQGPDAARVLARLLDGGKDVFGHFPYFSFKGSFTDDGAPERQLRLVDGTPLLLSRSGYTGEFGFELFVWRESAGRLWDHLLDSGAETSVAPCGLAARDSLRAGAVLPLSHRDIGPWPFANNPWRFALPYQKEGNGFTKSFFGGDALLGNKQVPNTYPFAGFDLRKVDADSGIVLNDAGKEIGEVLTCATDMAVGRRENVLYSIASPDKPEGFVPRGICCGFVRVRTELEEGQRVLLRDDRREISVEIVADVRPHRTARMAIERFLE